MISFVEGNLVEKTPTYVIIDCNGLGYHINISLQTYSKLGDAVRCRLYTHLSIKEDAHILFGFADQEERSLFRHLITVQGVGANSARMILSSLNLREIYQAIVSDNHATLQLVKGIGAKTAQKIVLELKDKLAKEVLQGDFFIPAHNTLTKEALSALVTLGFPKNQADKAIAQVIKQRGESLGLEELIKFALKLL